MATRVPRIVVAGLSGDGGKTIVTLGLLSALRDRGYAVSTFKKGPDYIDPAWIGRVAGTACRNLDTWIAGAEAALNRFAAHSRHVDIAVVEGNRGLFDGKDVWGSHSTSELAKLLRAPVILAVDARKATRTVAALVRGCIDFDPDVEIAGVVLNRVAGERHQRLLRETIEEFAGVPVVGAVPELGATALIPGRHLGLVPPSEYGAGNALEAELRRVADRLDVDAVVEIAAAAGPLPSTARAEREHRPPRARVGYFRDEAFTFYYPENLEALQAEGAELVPVSSIDDASLPEIDALYIGGGFPETNAERLSGNRTMMAEVRAAADAGLPIYAECGGLIYLSRSLRWQGKRFPMAGVFPIDLEMHDRPRGHGYTLVRVDRPNAFYPVGTTIAGHEFHYSSPIGGGADGKTCMTVATGTGVGGARDGLVAGNTLACYTHVHADGTPGWAPAIVERAVAYAHSRATNEQVTVTNAERHASWQK